jgi:TonB-dependent starch-binding outer membrane protein SusC
MRRRLRFSIGVFLVALWVSPAFAQEPTGSVLGHVTDRLTQGPIQGVSISIGSRTAVTRADGSYLINGVPAGSDSLRARMIGYDPQSQLIEVVSGQTLIVDLTLNAHAVNLSEMVVVGYGEQAAGNITGAVTNVKPEEFNTGRIITPTELIQSKVAGVQVVESNEPGGSTTIRIRGPSSTGASNDPLIVVDGVPLGGGASTGSGVTAGRDPLNFINAEDIASITVLRDASAAAIYGTNAANGVVIITTKRGGQGRPAFEYTGTLSSSSVTRLPSMLNAAQFRAAVQQYDADHGTTYTSQLLNANTNWFDQVDRTGFGQEHTFAFSGAGGSMDYRFSLNYLNQKGIIDDTKAERVTLGANYNQRLLDDRFNLKVNLRASRAGDKFTPGGVLSNAAQMGPTQPVKDPTTQTGFYDWPGNQLTSADNPVAIVKLASDKATTDRVVGGVQSEYRLPWLEGLAANLNVGFDGSSAERTFFDPSTLHAQSKTGTNGRYARNSISEVNTVVDAYLHYAVPRTVGPGLLDVTGGYSFAKSHGEFPTITATGLSTDLLGSDGIPAADFVSSTQNVQDSKLISFFGRVNYNVNDRYLAALSVRRDGSSRFGPSNQWGTFPSVALAWRLSDESFLKGFSALSDLKLRATWARTGNQSFGNYLWATSYQVGDAQVQYSFGDTLFTTIRPNGVDPNIKWEATRTYNLGLDFGFKDQRFSGAIDWYDKRTSDLIFAVPPPAGSALSDLVLTNIGTMRNQGIEMSLSARVLQGGSKGLNWNADFTFASNRNRLLSINPNTSAATQILTGGIAGGVGSRIQVLMAGEPVNSFFVYQHKRDANGKPIYADVNGDGSITDIDLYVDRNGDGQITQDDRRAFHDPAPKFILGHSSYLSYGKFDLGFTVRAYLGNYVYNNVASNLGTLSELGRGSPYNLHSSVLKTGFATPQYLSDYYVEKASFLRMDNLTLGYTFSIAGKPARAFGTLQNVFTITGYDGVDPTAGSNGIDNNIYPRSRTFTSGLSLRF